MECQVLADLRARVPGWSVDFVPIRYGGHKSAFLLSRTGTPPRASGLSVAGNKDRETTEEIVRQALVHEHAHRLAPHEPFNGPTFTKLAVLLRLNAALAGIRRFAGQCPKCGWEQRFASRPRGTVRCPRDSIPYRWRALVKISDADRARLLGTALPPPPPTATPDDRKAAELQRLRARLKRHRTHILRLTTLVKKLERRERHLLKRIP